MLPNTHLSGDQTVGSTSGAVKERHFVLFCTVNIWRLILSYFSKVFDCCSDTFFICEMLAVVHKS